MPPTRVVAFAGRHVPQAQVPVEAGRDEAATVRAERQRADGLAMSGQGAEALTGLRAPDRHVPIPARRGEAVAVGAERDVDPHICVSGELVDELAVPPVPD